MIDDILIDQVNFDLEDREMKIFSEDETMVSTSVGSELSLRSPLEEVVGGRLPKTSSPAPRQKEGGFMRGGGGIESPTKSRRMSFKVR